MSSLRLALGDDPVHRMPFWAWRLGEALLLALPNEPYSVFQVELRRRFAGHPAPRPDDHERWRRLPAPAGDLRLGPLPGAAVAVCTGCLEQAIDAAAEALEPLRA